MAKLLATLGLLLAVAGITSSASILPTKVNVEVVSSKQMKEILKEYPNAIELSQRSHVQDSKQDVKDGVQQALVQPDILVEYYLGARVPGDFLVAFDQQYHSWGTPQDIQMTLTYPQNGGSGYILSHMSIVVRQTNGGRAYVVQGGIGYRYATVIVEAYQTYVFDHTVNFYGY